MTDLTPPNEGTLAGAIPEQVKAEVKKELKKKDYSWIRKDYAVVGVLFIFLSVLNITTTLVARDAREAARDTAQIVGQTDIIANLMKNTGICMLLASIEIRGGADVTQVDMLYDDCILSRVGPLPPVQEKEK